MIKSCNADSVRTPAEAGIGELPLLMPEPAEKSSLHRSMMVGTPTNLVQGLIRLELTKVANES